MIRKNDRLITFARFGDEVEALQTQQKLEDGNIRLVLLGMVGSSMFPRMRTKASEIIIQIFEKDLDDAKRILGLTEPQDNR